MRTLLEGVLVMELPKGVMVMLVSSERLKALWSCWYHQSDLRRCGHSGIIRAIEGVVVIIRAIEGVTVMLVSSELFR